jgi:hypothetical protein
MHNGKHTREQCSSFLPFPVRLVPGVSLPRLLSRMRAWLLRETYALPLDVFRVLVGCLCVVYFLRLLLEVRDFSSPDGLLDHELLSHILWFTRLSLFHPGLGTAFFYGVYGLACLGACSLVLGYRVKLWAAVLFVIAVSHYRWNFIVMFVDDAIIHLLLFWLLLLPVGKTLCWREFWQQRQHCLERWSQVTVPGTALRCFLGNVCLVYLVAGLWKLESPIWRQGFALYAVLRLPMAYAPDFWGPQHLPLLQVGTYLALVVEPLLPLLLTRRPGHPLKWLGLLVQLGFHLGIAVTLRVPLANIGLLASAVLFFREELMHRVLQRQEDTVMLPQAQRFDRAGRLAIALLLVLILAMMRRLPGIGVVHMPAYALLWMVGIAQEYQLFNWIDTKNYYVEHRVTSHVPGSVPAPLDPTTIFPQSMRGVLLQTYLHNVRWMLLPRQHRRILQQRIIERLAQRFCRTHPMARNITVSSVITRIRPDDVALTRGRKQFWMHFQCLHAQATLCRTFLNPRVSASTACLPDSATDRQGNLR